MWDIIFMTNYTKPKNKYIFMHVVKENTSIIEIQITIIILLFNLIIT